MDHPFTFSSFKIKSDDQIRTLQRLGLDKIRYSPARSDRSPLALLQQVAQPDPIDTDDANTASTPSLEDLIIIKAKQQRHGQQQKRQIMMAACERTSSRRRAPFVVWIARFSRARATVPWPGERLVLR